MAAWVLDCSALNAVESGREWGGDVALLRWLRSVLGFKGRVAREAAPPSRPSRSEEAGNTTSADTILAELRVRARAIRKLEEVRGPLDAYSDFKAGKGAHYVLGYPESLVPWSKEEMKRTLIQYAQALRDLGMLDSDARDWIERGYMYLAQMLPQKEGMEALTAAEILEAEGLAVERGEAMHPERVAQPLISRAAARAHLITAEMVDLRCEFDALFPKVAGAKPTNPGENH
jgi:hypothetical protein